MLHAPVLTLDKTMMHEVDPRNVENLFGMWTIFSRCANTIEEGKRLENLSWRVWARETLCCPPQPEKTIVPAIDIPLPSKDSPTPSLSSSIGSDTDEDSIRTLEDSALSKSRGKETHLSPHTLERIVSNIKKEDTVLPLDPKVEAWVARILPDDYDQHDNSVESKESEQPSTNYGTESSCLSTLTTTTTNTVSTERGSQHRNSDTSVSSDGLIRTGSVVHGFSPLPSIRSRGSSTISKNLPTFAKKTNVANALPPKKTAMFTMGGSSEDESSFEQNMSYRKHMLEPRKSSLSQSFSRDDKSPQRKTTSFREVVEQHTIQTGGSPADDNAIASDDEDTDSAIDDSVIEEDDDEGWEDEQPEEEKPLTHPVFKRVDSSANLPSRRSLLTTGLTEGDRARGLLSAASKSSPAIRRMDRASSHTGPQLPSSPEKEEEEDGAMTMKTTTTTKSIPISPPTNASAYAMAHSPKTTRRNMLSTELTESLRKNLLWERQQKNTTVNAFLRREARSMANLQRAGQLTNTQPPPHRTLISRDQTRPEQPVEELIPVANEYNTRGW